MYSPRQALAFLRTLCALSLVLPVLSLSFLATAFPSSPLPYLVARAQRLLASLAGIHAVFGAPRDAAAAPSWLPRPCLRAWTSPSGLGCVRAFDQPGRWMADAALASLRAELAQVAAGALGAVPAHRLFAGDDAAGVRNVFSNRVVALAYDGEGRPQAFVAMVYLEAEAARGEEEDVIVHLGLSMVRAEARGRRMQSALFGRCLLLAVFNLRRLSYVVTSIAASPAGVGAVADYFQACYPHYSGAVRCSEEHRAVARHVLARFRHEFGCSSDAVFDEGSFVVHGSNMPAGGGAAAFIALDGTPVSRHSNPECNEYVARALDLAAGDEIFQVARFGLLPTLRAYLSASAMGSRG